MRAFLAITLPPDVQQRLAGLQRRAQAQVAAECAPGLLRWVQPAKLHLTLRFLGESEADPLARLQSGLSAELTDVAPFALNLGALGSFPGWQGMRVLWVGVRGEEAALARVAHICEEAAQVAGFPPEARVFHPHITLAYVRPRAERAKVRALGQALAEGGAALGAGLSSGQGWRVEAIHLVESRAVQGGRAYHPLAHWSLGGAGRGGGGGSER